MHTNPIDAKIRESRANSTTLLLRNGDLVIQAEFAEMAPCEFPIWSSSPVCVEIPEDRVRSFSVGPFSGAVTRKGDDGSYPETITFPVYRAQSLAGVEAYELLTEDQSHHLLRKVPVAALSTSVSGVVAGRLVQTHCVLPIWRDGSSVLVRLDWYQGETSEGTPNPEWHLEASTGRPAVVGLDDLVRASRLPAGARCSRFEIHVSPWMLGADLLSDQGAEIPNRIWQREWAFDSEEEFSKGVRRVTEGLLEPALESCVVDPV